MHFQLLRGLLNELPTLQTGEVFYVEPDDTWYFGTISGVNVPLSGAVDEYEGKISETYAASNYIQKTETNTYYPDLYGMVFVRPDTLVSGISSAVSLYNSSYAGVGGGAWAASTSYTQAGLLKENGFVFESFRTGSSGTVKPTFNIEEPIKDYNTIWFMRVDLFKTVVLLPGLYTNSIQLRKGVIYNLSPNTIINRIETIDTSSILSILGNGSIITGSTQSEINNQSGTIELDFAYLKIPIQISNCTDLTIKIKNLIADTDAFAVSASTVKFEIDNIVCKNGSVILASNNSIITLISKQIKTTGAPTFKTLNTSTVDIKSDFIESINAPVLNINSTGGGAVIRFLNNHIVTNYTPCFTNDAVGTGTKINLQNVSIVKTPATGEIFDSNFINNTVKVFSLTSNINIGSVSYTLINPSGLVEDGALL